MKSCRGKIWVSSVVFGILFTLIGCGPRQQVSRPVSSQTDDPKTVVVRLRSVFADEQTETMANFAIKNNSDHPIRIIQIDRPCGCTDVKASNDHLGPGEAATVSMGIRLEGRIGKQTFFCAPVPDRGSPWRCEAHINVLQRVQFTPQICDLGKLKASEQKVADFSCRFVARTPKELESASIQLPPSQAGFQIVETGSETIRDAEYATLERRFRVEVTNDKALGAVTMTQTVTATLSHTGGVATGSLQVMWAIKSSFEVLPNSLVIAPSDHRIEKQLLVVCDPELQIDAMEFVGEKKRLQCVQFNKGGAKSGKYYVRVRLDPEWSPNPMGESFSVRLRAIPDGQELNFPVHVLPMLDSIK